MIEAATFPVPLSGALDQKRDYKTQVPGSLIRIENAVRTKAERWDKRNGFASMITSTLDLSTGSAVLGNVAAGVHLGGYGAYQLALADGGRLFTYTDIYTKWLAAGYLPANTMTTRGVSQGGANYQTQADTAYSNGFSCTVWTTENGPCYAVYDDETGAEIVPVTGMAQVCRVVAVGNGFMFISVVINAVMTAYLNIASLTSTLTFATRTITGVTIATTKFWDVAAYDSSSAVFALAATVTAGGATCIAYGRISSTGVYVSGNHVEASARTCVNIVGDSGSSVFYVFHSGVGTSLSGAAVTASTAAYVSGSSFFPSQVNDFHNVTAVVTSTGNLTGFAEEYGFGSQVSPTMTGTRLHKFTMQYSSSTINNVFSIHAPTINLALVSKAFYDGTHAYAYVTYETVLQPTYFIIRDDLKLVTRFSVATAGGLWKTTAYASSGTWGTAVTSWLASVYQDFTTGFTTVLQRRLQETVVGPAPAYQSAVTYGLVRYSTALGASSFSQDELAGLSYYVKGTPRTYDGRHVLEQGFNIYPEDGITATAAAGGSLNAATYAYSIAFERTDSQGNVHRSAGSPVTTIAVLASQKVTFTINSLTAYPGEATVIPVLYFSDAGEADLLYRVSPMQYGVPLAVTQNPNTSGPVLYTAGGVLDDIAAPYAAVTHTHKNRVWLGGLETSELAFSKEAVQGEGVGFPDVFRIPVVNEGGPVTALGSVDEKLIILKADRLYYITGEGPNTLGQNWDYAEPTRIPSDVGTTAPNSVMQIPTGLIFKSAKGFFLLDRGLNIKYVGAGVEDLNSLTVTSAVLNTLQNEVRFTTSDGVCLVYNYYFDQWYTFTNYTAVSATVVNGIYYHLKANGTVNQEIAGLYQDNGVAISMALETSWLALAKLQGFQRIYTITLIADYVSRHHLKLSLARDYETTYNQVKTIDTLTVASGAILQYMLCPTIQKCEAIKLRIEDIDDIVGGGGASLRPTGLMVEIGRKRGTNKLSSAKKG